MKRLLIAFKLPLQLIAYTLLLIPAHGWAQDTLVKRNSEKVICKVIEVGSTNLKYLRWDLPTGPTYILPKEEVDFVRYANGVKEDFSTYAKHSETSSAKPDLTIQPSNGLYFYKGHLINEMDMLDLAWNSNDKKIRLLVSKTEHERIVKKAFFLAGTCLATASILNLTGIFNLYATSEQIARSGSTNNSYTQNLRARRTLRGSVSGDLMLGAAACGAVSLVYKFRERNNAHLVVNLYNKSLN